MGVTRFGMYVYETNGLAEGESFLCIMAEVVGVIGVGVEVARVVVVLMVFLLTKGWELIERALIFLSNFSSGS
jgi:hypothetical protein